MSILSMQPAVSKKKIKQLPQFHQKRLILHYMKLLNYTYRHFFNGPKWQFVPNFGPIRSDTCHPDLVGD